MISIFKNSPVNSLDIIAKYKYDNNIITEYEDRYEVYDIINDKNKTFKYEKGLKLELVFFDTMLKIEI